MDKESLLASLTSDKLVSNAKPDAAEQDLFGDIAIDDTPPPAISALLGTPSRATLSVEIKEAQTDVNIQAPTVHTEAPSIAAETYPTAPSAYEPPAVESLLSQSGLLGVAGIANTSEGLFDEVDNDDRKTAEKRMKNEQRMRQEEMGVSQRQETETHREFGEEQSRMQQQQHQQSLANSDIKQAPVQVNVGYSAPTYDQQSAMMQSAVIPQRQLHNQMDAMSLNNQNSSGFYSDHNSPIPKTSLGHRIESPNGHVGPTHQNTSSYFYGTREPKIQHQSHLQQKGYSKNLSRPSSTVGMHNSTEDTNLGRIRKFKLMKPEEVAPLYTNIRVTEPMLIQSQSFLISSPPYWSYQITSQLVDNQGTWLVRRRFRHVVALEDRLRQACPGSIIPPRPEKHATRALEEASTQQSAEFAVQRSKELEQYLNEVARHPVAGHSEVFRLFLGLQDDIGTAWPEVSTNALTRLQAVGAGVTMRVAESTNLTAASAPAQEWEEDAELLGLCSSESLRLGAVSQAVPKLEGTVIVLREQGDAAGILGMELSKSSKVLDIDYKFFEVLSSGLLRNGRRTKRLALETSAAMESFLEQYKLVRYEKMAMQDRRQALQRKAKERGRADARAVHLSQQQRHLQANGQIYHLNQLEQNAISMDTQALDAVSEANEIGARLRLEINRVAIDRRISWNNSIKIIASSMREACSERMAIWESTLEAFENLTKNVGQIE